MSNMKAIQRAGVIAASLLLAAAGCKSHSDEPVGADLEPDSSQHNRLLVNAALHDNTYNGIAVERAIYPKDFNPGSATLSELGIRRIEALVYASRTGGGRVSVIRGEEAPTLFDARVASVKKQIAFVGIDPSHISVGGDYVNGPGTASGLVLLTFDRFVADYVAKPQQANGGGTSQQGGTTGATSTQK